MRNIRSIHRAPARHWVGDGFHVSPLFNHMQGDKYTTPFLMLDYAMPQHFAPNEAKTPKGVGAHPHAGFETVTLALQGEVAHRDSNGGGGIIGAGDVQWMTAGNGIVHEEFHSEAFSKRGGIFEMVQLWVNLPAAKKNTAPAYQSIQAADIPVVRRDGGNVRIIAGELDGTHGAAHTHSELNMWEIDLEAGGNLRLPVPATHNLLLVALRGETMVNGRDTLRASELATFTDAGDEIRLSAGAEAGKLLLLSGVPIDEPIAAYGPFVMNTHEEILEKIRDYNAGKFGHLAA
ncbi:pirin family protein [uncultured Cardiobacterium sp.]|uniref:pirin family protein n=1 Tax=uncultured Cardiobacterium sp. TaxID=417619 RepID=UPI003423338B